jgi:hypothetical protein
MMATRIGPVKSMRVYRSSDERRLILVEGNVCIYLNYEEHPYRNKKEPFDYWRADADALRIGVWGDPIYDDE